MRHIIIKHICLVFLLLLALSKDLKSYKIPNTIILIGYLFGLFFFCQEQEWTSIHKWVLSIFIPILILFPLFFIKALGAGDIKLFSVIGGFFGISYVINLIVISFLIGGILAVFQLCKNKNLSSRISFFLSYVKKLHLKVTTSDISNTDYVYYSKDKEGTRNVIHFSVAIFLGFLIKLIVDHIVFK
ncbi:MAG: prepilin peptidase [Anaerocolumna sp.]